MKTILAVLFAVFAATGFAGCVATSGGPHSGAECIVPEGHVHDDVCGHYHFGGRWYIQQGHRHGNNCGHVFIEGSWTVGH